MTKEIRIRIVDNGYEVSVYHSISCYNYVFESWGKVIGFIEWCNKNRNLHPPMFFN